MNVVVTILFLAVVAVWAFAVYNKLLRLRDRVKEAWRHLEADQTNQSAMAVYNRTVESYNSALSGFPANLIALAAGFKPAQRFQ